MKHLALIALLLGLSASAAEDRLQQAIRLQQNKPTPERELGLLEMRRAASEKLDYPRLADQVRPTRDNAPLLQAIAWRMLPIGQRDRSAFLRVVDTLEKSDAQNVWSPIFRLYAQSLANDRTALIVQAQKIAAVPAAFPSVAAEKAHLDLLREIGLDDNQAAMEVITHRSFAPLHALLGLDRVLTREIDFLNGTSRAADAKTLSTCRDKLRQAWLDSSKHLVERLFALHALGRKQECDALLFAARELPYLTDVAELAKVLARMEQNDAWQALIAPLLDSEVALISTPPRLPATMPTAVAEVSIQARRKTIQEGIATYEGAVRVTSRALTIACDKLAVIGADTANPRMLSGAGNVSITGAPGYPQSVQADHFTLSFDTGALSLGGNVRLKRGDTILKLKAATISRTGELRDQISWLDDFDKAPDVKSKLAALAKLSGVLTDDELPAEAKYLLAMTLLRPRLAWHEDYDEPPRRADVLESRQDEQWIDFPWREAHGGEPWMREDAIRQLQASRRDALRNDKVEQLLARELPRNYFWTIDDPKHPDIQRAIKLLNGCLNTLPRYSREGHIRTLPRYSGGGQGGGSSPSDLPERTRRWLDELTRNNATVTLDVAGAFPANKPAKVVADIRSADKLTLALYRVREPATLLAAARQIGQDYLFRDYGLNDDIRILRDLVKIQQIMRARPAAALRARPAGPQLDERDLLQRWDVRVADLKRLDDLPHRHRAHDLWDEWAEDDDEESSYFDDRCERFRDRIEKTYAREGRTTWRADRVINIPADLLKEPGAYILLAQAGECRAVAPLLVDPLSLTLRRCRDGVLVVASSTDATAPIPNATILAENAKATTDPQGVAFARVFASGDQPIVAAADGRFAIGGFGDLFDGLYHRADDREYLHRARLLPDRKQRQAEQLAHVYEDRFVLAAYTDRPTYRPGHDVHFKLIARELLPQPANNTTGFRDADFDRSTQLKLPADGTRFSWSVFSPRGREVSRGEGTLNDFATAAASVKLGEHAEVGLYSLRVRLADMDRIIPDLFAVKYYKRPNFEIALTGIPQQPIAPGPLNLAIDAAYYFGKPVASADVDIRLTKTGDPIPLAQQRATLDAKGHTDLSLSIPADLLSGRYRIAATVTDSANISLTKSAEFDLANPNLARTVNIPPFIQIGQSITLSTEHEVHIVHRRGETEQRNTLTPKDRKVTIPFTTGGWHDLSIGSTRAAIFVYGDNVDPFTTQTHDEGPARFVNLADYSEEGDGDYSRHEPWQEQVHALFDSHQAQVGSKLRLLIYTPVKKPRLLFTFEGRTIVDYTIVQTANDSHFQIVELPIRARHLPNFYLQARVIGPGPAAPLSAPRFLKKLREQRALDDDASQDPRWCRVDVTDPSAAPASQKLRIDLKTDRPDYKPGDTVHVTGNVTSLAGEPRQAELSLAAVDESVFSFGETDPARLIAPFADPHPPRRFLPKSSRQSIGHAAHRRQMMHLMDKMQQAAQQLAQAAEAAKSLDAARNLERPAPLPALGHMPINQIPFPRSDFRETAAWIPQLRTDDRGALAASFKLPDSLTAYRLTAVGLTRQTDIGIAAARFRATLPLAAQLILPRFAVEKDRFAAVALLHNNTDAPLDCKVTLEFKNITPQPTSPWKIANNTATASLAIPAKSSSTLPLDFLCDHIGVASFTLRAVSKDHADAEQRTLNIVPLGRPAEISLNGAFDATHSLALRDGFIPSDLHISLSRGQVAQSLDGLQYLIDYPYGCAEQTMSRFLPAVVVKAAARDLPLELPADVVAKLPEVIQRGLDRLYSFQNPDGGWGWFANNRSDDRMSIYVLEGLARCRLAGVSVDDSAIERGATFVSGRLDQLDDKMRAPAFHALALTGRTDRTKLAAWANDIAAKDLPPETRCQAALACRAAGLAKQAQSLWSPLRNWNAQSAADLAAKLTAQLAFGEPISAANQTAALLCNLRQGHRWDSTQTTAIAITALAQVLQYQTASAPAKLMRIKVAGQTALDAKGPELDKAVFRLHLTGPRIAQNALPITLESDPSPTMLYTLTATGYQRLENAQPTGTAIRLSRKYATLAGQPITTAKPKDLIAVTLTLHLDRPQEYLIIEDPRPSLFEYAGEDTTGQAAHHLSNAEFRDDKAALFFTQLSAGDHTLTYYLRAQTTGQAHALPAAAYPMYNEKQKGESGTTKLEVRP